jgi:hypothetical protein
MATLSFNKDRGEFILTKSTGETIKYSKIETDAINKQQELRYLDSMKDLQRAPNRPIHWV